MAEWDALRDEILGIVKERSGDLLEQNKAAQQYLLDRAIRLAQLTWKMGQIPKDAEDSEARIARVQAAMAVVSQTIDNDVAALKIKAAAVARTVFSTALKVIADTLTKGVPLLRGIL